MEKAGLAGPGRARVPGGAVGVVGAAAASEGGVDRRLRALLDALAQQPELVE